MKRLAALPLAALPLAALPLAALPVVFSLALSGCVTFRTIDDGISRARIGETATRDGVTVRPLAVVEDSRCPKGVACIQAGTVRIDAEVAGSRALLALGQPVATGAGGSVTLVEVSPERRADVTLYPDEYRFGFRVTR